MARRKSGRQGARRESSLSAARAEIDRIDGEIVGLLDRRAGIALETASHKKRGGQSLYQPSREADVMHGVLSRRTLFPESSLAAVYREIMGACLTMERPFSIAILGPIATYTHVAAIKHFGRGAKISFEPSIPDVFLRVEKEDADIGIVPVENSTEGAVLHTLDTLVESSLLIAGEILLPIRHNLLVNRSAFSRGGRAIRKILSHPQALAQCRNTLEAYFPGVPVEAVSSTAFAAKQAARGKGIAAIASELAAEHYGLEVLRGGIEDSARNTTRFLLLKRPSDEADRPLPRVKYKTSIAFAMKDKPGALFKMLAPFQKNRINLTKIESRPSRVQAWSYVFFLDMEGHLSDARLLKAFRALEEECSYFRVLGSYARNPAALRR